MSKYRSADRLRERLASSDEPSRLYQGETLYHVQVDYTCQLLDVVDEVTDEVTATLITDAIYERLAGESAFDAMQRMRDANAELTRWRMMGLPT